MCLLLKKIFFYKEEKEHVVSIDIFFLIERVHVEDGMRLDVSLFIKNSLTN